MIRILRTILKIDSQLGKNESQTAMRTRLIRALCTIQKPNVYVMNNNNINSDNTYNHEQCVVTLRKCRHQSNFVRNPPDDTICHGMFPSQQVSPLSHGHAEIN